MCNVLCKLVLVAGWEIYLLPPPKKRAGYLKQEHWPTAHQHTQRGK